MRQADTNGITVEKFHALLSLARYYFTMKLYVMIRHRRDEVWCYLKYFRPNMADLFCIMQSSSTVYTVKRMSHPKSWVSSGYSGFLPQGMVSGWFGSIP